MKYKLVFLSCFYFSLAKAQGFNNPEGNSNLLSSIFISFAFILILWFVIGKIESISKVKDIFYKRDTGLIMMSIGAFVILVILYNIVYDNNILLFGIGLVSKVALAIFTSMQAEKLNKNKNLWFVLGLVEPFSALIVLGLSNRYLTSKLNKSELLEINTDMENQIKKIQELRNSELLTNDEFEQKKQSLAQKYYEGVEGVINSQKVNSNNSLISKLEIAYNEGLLTKDEYESKLKQINN